ncbi:LOW QUALITY PROTEIN: exopolyphosphatase PRUNE1 [Acridotheres tristis]
MERFVAGNRAALQDHIRQHQEIHVVMGNEACDLDSTVSALALAYFLAQSSPAPRAAFVPVLNIPRADFALRTETSFLLRDRGIPGASLIFRDEIDLGGLHHAGLLSLTLVDHHVLPCADAALEEAVVEVLDHRPLERPVVPPCQVTVEPVGSCATLVTERILQGPPGVLDRTTAALLHGTILLDCINLSPAAGKVTPRDVACVSLLEERFPELPARDAVFGALQAAKFDVTGLTTEQMLRKDLKVVRLGGEGETEAGSGTRDITVMPRALPSAQTFLLRPGLLQDLEAFCQGRGYAGLVAMTVSFNERHEPTRKLAVYSQQEPLRGTLCRALEEATTPSLLLQLLPSPWASVAAYAQGNAVAARKKVLPILRAALGGLGAAGGPEEEVVPPPTPMNSLVEECPLAQAVPPLCPQDVLERVSRIAVGQPPGSPK